MMRRIEKRLRSVTAQLRDLRHELSVVDEQLAQLADEADDARLRSLVSETPLADHEHREAARHADAMARHRSEILSEITRLEVVADELLDRLNDNR
jgi:chromosome segregation ATPase